MSERIEAELELVRSVYPDLEFRAEDLWARLPSYPFPDGWGREHGEIAFRFPLDVFGEEPYGFWVRPPLQTPSGGTPSNSSGPVATGYGEGWQQFSWAPDGWHPAPEVRCGTNMLDWVRSFTRRLKEIG